MDVLVFDIKNKNEILLIVNNISIIINYSLILICYTEADGRAKKYMYWSKDVKEYRLRNVYVAKNFQFRFDMLKVILENAAKPLVITKGVSY